MITRPRFLLLALPLVLAIGCSSSDEDPADEHEDEPVATGSDAIISGVDCQISKQPAYDHGSPFTIEVIHIGGKPTAKPTGHAFLKMQKAADAAGVSLTINSGFRTMAEQQYLYACYQHGNCNNGNLAAKPGYSNHQSGRALDLTTSTWLANNAARFGFKRTVPSEAWHYEFFGADPGGPCSAGATNPPPVADAGAPPVTPPGGHACSSDGQCNPGNDGAGLMCQAGTCVPGCHTSAQCSGNTTCVAGQCH